VLIVVRIFRLKDEDVVKHQADACEYLDDVPWIGSRDEVSIDLERGRPQEAGPLGAGSSGEGEHRSMRPCRPLSPGSRAATQDPGQRSVITQIDVLP
jgi:hypothetical protein